MITVETFKQMEMLEQLETLENIKKTKPEGGISALYDLYTNPIGDDAIDYMVGMTLRELLVEDETATVSGLTHANPQIQKLCLQICGQQSFGAAIPVLLELFRSQKQGEFNHDLFQALAKSGSREFVEIFRDVVNHPEEDMAAIAIDVIGKLQDESSVDRLCRIVAAGETDENYKECGLATGAAIEALGRIPGEKAVSFLVSKLHYRNPTGRLLIHQALVKKGSEVIPKFEAVFAGNDIDDKIMAANVLGMIGDKKGGEILISAMDTGVIQNANVKYAVYEALGYMQFLKGTVFLMDGLLEQDPLLLTAVMTSLDSQLNPGVIKKLFELIRHDEQQGERLIQAIVTSRAMNIFESLYVEADIAKLLIAEIASMKDRILIDMFQEKLTAIGTEAAIQDARVLSGVTVAKGAKTILVVDDSKAMLAFFRATLSGFGLTVVTAENGKRANDLLLLGQHADLIFTDMNMPEMDGIEFTRLTRKNAVTQNTPVVMISTESEMSQVELAKEAGVNGILNKPFTKEKLKETVETYL